MLKPKLLSATAAVPEVIAIEDVFSTWLYTGNGSAQVIENGINLGQSNAGGSVYFNGANDTYVGPSVSLLSSSSSFTFECFAYFNTTGSSSDMGMVVSQYEAGQSGRMLFGSQAGSLVLRVNGATVYLTGAISINQWYHIAWTFDGSTHRLFIDGTLVDSSSSVPSLYTGVPTTFGGQPSSLLNNFNLDGYLSNIRIVSGSALYTSSFTPPTSALTAVSGTSLLTCQGADPFVDNSSNTFTITKNGNPQAKSFGPFDAAEAGEGGLVWTKARSFPNGGDGRHALADTERSSAGSGEYLSTNSTASAETAFDTDFGGFNSNGYSLSGSTFYGALNLSGNSYTSWTFRKAPRFFDVVTFSTTTGSSTPITVNHNLGATPGCIIVKQTNAAADWFVYHRSASANYYLSLNSTDFQQNGGTSKFYPAPDNTSFYLGGDFVQNGTYVAYLFAHDPLGPSGDGSDGLIACGSYTGNGSSNGPEITLGWEPQWLLLKSADNTGDWVLADTMRGIANPSPMMRLYPNLTTEEQNFSSGYVTSTGFKITATGTALNGSGANHIYIAIRRGPMREPTSGTEVLESVAFTGDGAANRTIGSSLTPDLVLLMDRDATSTNWSSYAQEIFDRIRGENVNLATSSANAEVGGWANTYFNLDQQIGWSNGSNSAYTNNSGTDYVSHNFRRAPGFFDVVAYTGTGSARTVAHNLGVSPELMLFKKRNASINSSWMVWNKDTGYSNYDIRLTLNNGASYGSNITGLWSGSIATSTSFGLGTSDYVNGSGNTYIAYLFATLPGVSKVGSYTGNGSSQTINCGFTSGARFVLIKRTDSTGDWYVWDSARGIVAGNDPHLSLNTAAAEVTTDDSVDAESSGFIVNQDAATNVNVSSASYIFLAVS